MKNEKQKNWRDIWNPPFLLNDYDVYDNSGNLVFNFLGKEKVEELNIPTSSYWEIFKIEDRKKIIEVLNGNNEHIENLGIFQLNSDDSGFIYYLPTGDYKIKEPRRIIFQRGWNYLTKTLEIIPDDAFLYKELIMNWICETLNKR